MNRRLLILSTVLTSALALWGCTTAPYGPGWVTLIDGSQGL